MTSPNAAFAVDPDALDRLAATVRRLADDVATFGAAVTAEAPPRGAEVFGEAALASAYRAFHEVLTGELHTIEAAAGQVADGLQRAAAAYDTSDHTAGRRFG
jgi:hypothetical protein